MMNKIGSSLSLIACASLLAVTAIAGQQSKAKPPASKTTATAAWPAETLNGKIAMVDPAAKLVVVKGSDGVPFDLRLTSSTRISSGSQRLTMKDLNQDKQKEVTVRFIPERDGDIARSIQVNG